MKLVVVIIILLAVLSTPLSLKKLIDRSNQGKSGIPDKEDLMNWMEISSKEDSKKLSNEKKFDEQNERVSDSLVGVLDEKSLPDDFDGDYRELIREERIRDYKDLEGDH